MKNPIPANPAMTDTLLFEHFTTLATAPDGIAGLRELILQLAVQGKLGTQDVGDEPASELLETVKKQIRKISSDGSREKEISPFDEHKIPFILPKNWVWTQIGTICTPTQYGWTTQGSTTGKIHLLRTTDITSGNINWDTVPYCSEVPTDLEKYLITDGDIVISRAGSVGESHLIKNPKKSVFASYLIRFKPMINRDYFAFFLKSPYYWSVISDESLGTGVPNVNATKLRNCYFPLPPLAEQHRIVVKVNQLMTLCDELEARQQLERAGCLKLGTASLAGLQNAESPEEFGRQWAQVCDAFDLILDCPENVAVLRQTILQLAVQGRLVRQDPGDEPASKLLSKEKNDPVQTTDIPFDLPSGWIGTRCVSLCEKNRIITYGVIKLGSEISDGVPVLRSSDVKFLHINDFKVKRIDPSIAAQYQRTFLNGGEIVINVRGTLGGIAVVPRFMKGYNISREVAVIPIISKISEKYIAYALASPFCQNWLSKNLKGIAYSGINIADLKLLPVPLPPLTEQHRIVAKVDALMALCDALESRLKERAGVQARLAGAVVKQVAG
ncbi:MAG: restriction endonuclease subunit S [Methanoregula sp.]|nr:restriction endonuclease subunit S [Methanoregula sp.]